MILKRPGRRPNGFKAVVLVLVIGMAVTLGYQINLYYGEQAQPMAERAPGGPAVGG